MYATFEDYNPALPPDTRLDRTVAITVLPEHLGIDPDDDEEDDLDDAERLGRIATAGGMKPDELRARFGADA